MLRVPGPEDFLSFSAFDGVLVATFFVVSGVLCRILVKMFQKAGSKDPTLRTAYAVGSGVAAVAVAGGIAAWFKLPHDGVGIWGTGGIGGIVLAYASAMSVIRKSFRPKQPG